MFEEDDKEKCPQCGAEALEPQYIWNPLSLPVPLEKICFKCGYVEETKTPLLQSGAIAELPF